MMSLKLSGCIFMACLFCKGPAGAQTGDTLSLTLPALEAQFIKNNLQLLVQRYNVDKAAAGEITARLFANPTFSFGNGRYSRSKDTNALSQQTYAVSQLIQTAGKRNKHIQLAQINTVNAWHAFFDLLRTLKYSLRINYYTLYCWQQSIALYDEEIGALQKTLVTLRSGYSKGNIAEKEVLRIQSLLYSLQSEETALQLQINNVETELRILIRSGEWVYIRALPPPALPGQTEPKQVPYPSLLDSAIANRYDLKMARSNITYADINLKLQRAMNYPDLTWSLHYGRKTGYGLDYVAGGVAISLPAFNRNQGNIRLARVQLEQSKVQLDEQLNKLQNELAGGYQDALRLEQLYHTIDPSFSADFARLIREVYENFEKRNISLIEFLDLYAAYKTHMLLMYDLQLQRMNALEKLNFLTGMEIFKP